MFRIRVIAVSLVVVALAVPTAIGPAFKGAMAGHETVALDPAGPAGDVVVTHGLAPLGVPLTYMSGGNGLIGRDGAWPVLPDSPANRALAANAYDHVWLQFDPAIVWVSPVAIDRVFAIPGIDHDPLPGEALEFLIEGSNDGIAWSTGTVIAVYRDGFDPALDVVGLSDDYTSLWLFPQPYRLFRARSGDLVENFSSPGEGEIDALASADQRPPIAGCVESVNPHGQRVPPAGSTTLPGPKGGQNEDGFYELTADDDVDPNPAIFVVDTGSGTVFGPFLTGDKIKYTEDSEVAPSSQAMGSTGSGNHGQADAIAAHIIGTGDPAVIAVDGFGQVSEQVVCLVPPPPK